MKQILLMLCLVIGFLSVNSQSVGRLWTVLDDTTLSMKALSLALGGMHIIRPANDSIVTIIDFTLPSTQERLWIIDVKNHRILLKTYVAHGRNTGENWAMRFSNEPNSLMSSPGFYLTGKIYYGKHGYSLTLQGLEPGINDKAMDRRIVVHGAWYVGRQFIKKYGRLGRSYGCPAVPEDISRQVIDLIKDGCLLFIFTDDSSYLSKSGIIKQLTGAAYQSFF